MSKGEEIVEEIVKDRKAVRRLAEAIVSDADVRLAVVNAILRDVATKEDVEKLRAETKADIDRLREEIDARFKEIDARFKEIDARFDSIRGELSSLGARVSKLEGQVGLMVGMNVAVLVAVIGILLRLIF
jgi:chromosome segregation ATPase